MCHGTIAIIAITDRLHVSEYHRYYSYYREVTCVTVQSLIAITDRLHVSEYHRYYSYYRKVTCVTVSSLL